MFSNWFSSSKKTQDKCAPNADDVSRDLKNLVLHGLRDTAEETAKDLFSEKPTDSPKGGTNSSSNNDPCTKKLKEVENRTMWAVAKSTLANVNDLIELPSSKINQDSGMDDAFFDVWEGALTAKEEIRKEEEQCRTDSTAPKPVTQSYFDWFKNSFLTPIMDELWRMTEAEHKLNEQGILPPVVPNRMQCAPNPNDMLEAFNTGMDLGAYMTENVPRPETQTMDQFVDSMGGSLFMVSAQLWKDTKNLKHCMDKQDENYQKEMKEYIEQVKEVAEETKPAPILHDPRRLDPNLSRDEVLAIRQRENTKRYTKGLPQFPLDSPIWDGYNWLTSCTNGNYSPFAGSHDGKSSLLEGGLMPDSSGATIDPSHCGSDSVGNGSGGGGGGSDLMNIDINCSGGHWESNSDGSKSCKM